MKKSEQIELAASLLDWPIEKTKELCKEKPEINALLFCDPCMGGASMYMASDGSVLFANSAVSPDEHKKAFLDGIRTPISSFSK